MYLIYNTHTQFSFLLQLVHQRATITNFLTLNLGPLQKIYNCSIICVLTYLFFVHAAPWVTQLFFTWSHTIINWKKNSPKDVGHPETKFKRFGCYPPARGGEVVRTGDIACRPLSKCGKSNRFWIWWTKYRLRKINKVPKPSSRRNKKGLPWHVNFSFRERKNNV